MPSKHEAQHRPSLPVDTARETGAALLQHLCDRVVSTLSPDPQNNVLVFVSRTNEQKYLRICRCDVSLLFLPSS